VEALAILAVALAVAALAVAVVAARHLRRRTKWLEMAVTEATDRITPLLEELEQEAAVTAAEVEHLTSGGAPDRHDH
jgi:tRNA A37 threonylcarbamoyladenosine modification protein TsaB